MELKLGDVQRTIMLDRQLKGIIDQAPDTVVVNIGAGFDNRFSHMDNGKIWWFDLDLPDSIAARRKVFLAEGLFMYFTLEQIRTLLNLLTYLGRGLPPL